MDRKRPIRHDARGAQRGSEKDLLTGVILAIVIPVLAFILARALDLSGQGTGLDKQREPDKPPPTPLSLDYARDVLAEVKRLYEVNYSAVYVPRVEHAMSSGAATELQVRKREFESADTVFARCTDLLARLKEDAAKPDSELAPLRSDIQNWDQVLAQALERHDRLNPVPKSFRVKS